MKNKVRYIYFQYSYAETINFINGENFFNYPIKLKDLPNQLNKIPYETVWY